MSSKNILVLGATGFVGRNLIDVFAREGVDTISTSMSSGVDLRNLEEAEVLFESVRPDFIINCAAHVGSLNYVAEQAADVVYDNTMMMLNIYRAVTKHCGTALVINPIANCCYPGNAVTFREEDWWNGHLHRSVLSYGSTRRNLWAIAECHSMQYGVRSIHLLVPNMYGPYDSTDPNKAHALNALVCKFIRASRSGQPVSAWGTGVAIREWLFAPDFARIALEVVQSNGEIVGLAEPLNVAQNFGLSVRELVGLISKQFDSNIAVTWATERPDGAPRKVMDNSRFRQAFPDFAFTSLSDGLARTVDYYLSNCG